MTAVDYLIEQLQAPCRGIPSHIIEQAKEMEKQQIVDAYANAVKLEDERNRVTSSQTEISDEEIEEAISIKSLGILSYNFIAGAKWYREQLKKKQ